jgi:hypothetical protein
VIVKREGEMRTFYDHDDLLKNISGKTLAQLKGILKESALPQNENSLKRIIESWLIKRAMFNKIIEHGNFRPVKKYYKDNKNACIAITLSGSILAIGPIIQGFRKITYISLNMRTDVPNVINTENSVISEDIEVDKILNFTQGPIKKTSEIVDIGVAQDEDDPEKQVKKIIEINKLLLDNFIQINQSTFKSNYFDNELNGRNDLFKKWIIIEWFVLGGMDRHVFLARAKILWIELFTKLYKELSSSKKLSVNKDNFMIEFSNIKFAKFIDDYKWYESEKKNFDIGLMKALEEIPGYMNYWDYQNNYISELNSKALSP